MVTEAAVMVGVGKLARKVAQAKGGGDGKIIETSSAEEVNNWWKQKGYDHPPYKPGTIVKEIELTTQKKFVRVYDGNVSGKYGGWVMNAKDIKGLSPKQIQNKYSLPQEPKYICDVDLPKGTKIRTGVASKVNDWGTGGGLQYDLKGKQVGEFTNERILK